MGRHSYRRLLPALAVFALVTAPLAHADDQGYIAELNNGGVPAIVGPQQEVIMGNQVCTALHNGITPAPNEFLTIQRPWVPTIIGAAQHNLCPDTLH